MYNGMKYIVFEAPHSEGLKALIPVVFHQELVHAEVASGLQLRCENLRVAKPVSAGFCSIVDAAGASGWDWRPYGRSESLHLDSNPDDAETLGYLFSRGLRLIEKD